jgi:hypothetical protein
MATVATRQEKNFAQRKNETTHLTPTGLLMEGHFTQNRRIRVYGRSMGMTGMVLLRAVGSKVIQY